MKRWTLAIVIILLGLGGAIYAYLYPPFPDSGWTTHLPDGSEPTFR